MKLKLLKTAAALALCGMASVASAGVVTSLYGDIDGYGQTSGHTGTITDKVVYGDQSWTQSFGPLSGILSATVQIGHAALGYFPPRGGPRLYLDNVFVGSLTDMDRCDGSAAPGVSGCGLANYTFDLLSIGALGRLTDGIANFRIDTGSGDGWVLDYSKLTITTRDVPEPGVLMLMAIGLVGVGAARYKKQQKDS